MSCLLSSQVMQPASLQHLKVKYLKRLFISLSHLEACLIPSSLPFYCAMASQDPKTKRFASPIEEDADMEGQFFSATFAFSMADPDAIPEVFKGVSQFRDFREEGSLKVSKRSTSAATIHTATMLQQSGGHSLDRQRTASLDSSVSSATSSLPGLSDLSSDELPDAKPEAVRKQKRRLEKHRERSRIFREWATSEEDERKACRDPVEEDKLQQTRDYRRRALRDFYAAEVEAEKVLDNLMAEVRAEKGAHLAAKCTWARRG